MATTPTSKYALGRNTMVSIGYAGSTKTICISDGSIDLSANSIEIVNNCNNGWSIKLPGIKSGTITLTGYLATVSGSSPLTWLGQIVTFAGLAYDGDVNQGQSMYFGCSASVTGARISIDANDACRVEMTLEISGQPDTTSYMGIAGF